MVRFPFPQCRESSCDRRGLQVPLIQPFKTVASNINFHFYRCIYTFNKHHKYCRYLWHAYSMWSSNLEREKNLTLHYYRQDLTKYYLEKLSHHSRSWGYAWVWQPILLCWRAGTDQNWSSSPNLCISM